MTRTDGPLTLGRWFRDRATASPDRVAVDVRGEVMTYAQLDDRSERLAGGLRRAGLIVGDRVATVTTNSAAHVVVLAACAKAGLVMAPLNPRLTAGELAWQIDDCQPALLLAGPAQRGLADDAASRSTWTVPHRHGMDALDDVSGETATSWGVADDDPLLLMYTSGTTGRPKGALLTHANCFWTNLSLDRVADVTSTDVVLQVLPQFHVGGWNVQPLLAWWKGATVVLEPTFEPAEALRRIADRGVTTMMGVPATYRFMAADAGFDTADLSRLRQAVVGGAPMDVDLLTTWHHRGVALIQGYGLTEAAPNVLGLAAEHVADRVGSAGRPYPGVEVALRDPSGALVEGPGRGELLVRGPNVFVGYWGDPDATAATFADGWLCTGDVASRDADGFYTIVDRLKDLYVSGGENVYPAEVEAVLVRHDDVAEAAVVGVPDPRWGEAGRAVVVLRPGATADPDELRTFCRTHLAGFKVPREVEVVDELPRSSVGKVLKSRLAKAHDPEGTR